MFFNLYLSFVKCSLFFISSLNNSEELDRIKKDKQKIKTKKLSTHQISMGYLDIDPRDYELVSKIMVELSIRLHSIMKEIFGKEN